MRFKFATEFQRYRWLNTKYLTCFLTLKMQIPDHSVISGGMVPAAIIARELNIRLIDTICISSYDGQERGGLSLTKAPELPEGGNGWLII